MRSAPRRFQIALGDLSFPTPHPSNLKREISQNRSVASHNRLTDRETEVTAWIARGKTYPEIAKLLTISERTVRAHLENVCQKLNATNKTHAVALALMNSLIKF